MKKKLQLSKTEANEGMKAFMLPIEKII